VPLSGDASLRTLLVSMAINHARQHVRAAIRRRQRPSGSRASSCPPAGGRSRRALRARAALTRALDALPLDQRVAFVLCEVEERRRPSRRARGDARRHDARAPPAGEERSCARC